MQQCGKEEDYANKGLKEEILGAEKEPEFLRAGALRTHSQRGHSERQQRLLTGLRKYIYIFFSTSQSSKHNL